MLGFGALGEFALGEGPTQRQGGIFSQFSSPIRRAGLAVAVASTTFSGFVAPPPAQAAIPFTKFSEPAKKKPQLAVWNFSIPPAGTQTAIFTQFSAPTLKKRIPQSFDNAPQPGFFQPAVFSAFDQPRFAKAKPALQPQGLFETVPAIPPFTGFATFAQPLKAKTNVQYGFQPFIAPPVVPDTHDGVFVKKKRKKVGPDPIDLELEEKAKRRAAIELAVYGPEVTYEPQRSILEPLPPAPPPNVEDLARVIVQARNAEIEAQRLALEQDDEDVLEMILRDL